MIVYEKYSLSKYRARLRRNGLLRPRVFRVQRVNVARRFFEVTWKVSAVSIPRRIESVTRGETGTKHGENVFSDTSEPPFSDLRYYFYST